MQRREGAKLDWNVLVRVLSFLSKKPFLNLRAVAPLREHLLYQWRAVWWRLCRSTRGTYWWRLASGLEWGVLWNCAVSFLNLTLVPCTIDKL